MHVIIFSKDRAMQLDALLTTLVRYLPFHMGVSIIYTFSNAQFAAGYARLKWLCPLPVTWILEENFKAQVLAALRGGPEYTVMFTDDMMVFAPAYFTALADDVLCHSLRLGKNTTRCSVLSQLQSIPQDFPKWDYRSAEAAFAYPFATDGHIFRTGDLYSILRYRAWGSPNTLEASMQGAQRLQVHMTAPERSVCVAIPHNMVQTDFPNPHAGGNADDLNRMFLAGWRIDPFAMDFSEVNDTHFLVPFVFRATL